MARTVPVLLALILSVPIASAGIFEDEPLILDVGEPHSGTTMRYDVTHERTIGARVFTNASTVFVHIEDPSIDRRFEEWDGPLVRDRFGVLVKTDSYLIEEHREGDIVRAERCFALQQGATTVRRDVTIGVNSSEGGGAVISPALPIFGPAVRPTLSSTPTTEFGGPSCFGRQFLSWRELREGWPLMLGDVYPDLVRGDRNGGGPTSTPAEPTSIRNRPALEYVFDLSSLSTADRRIAGTVTVAAGLGGVLRSEFDILHHATHGARVRDHIVTELTGYVGGHGYIPPEATFATRPAERNPAATFAPRSEDLAFDDAALRLAYPYADALAAVLDDPTLPHDAAAIRHARLLSAEHDRRMRAPDAPDVPTDGGWILTFDYNGELYAVESVRAAANASGTPLGVLDGARIVRNRVVASGESLGYDRPFAPDELPTSASIASLVESWGVPPGSIERVVFEVYTNAEGRGGAVLLLSDVSAMGPDGPRHGRTALIDLETAGLFGIHETTSSGGSTGGLMSTFDESRNQLAAGSAREGYVPFGGPHVGQNVWGYAAAAATATAILWIVLKLLILPLFTRIVRDRVLDHPVRARMHAYLRLNPGAHLAEVTTAAGAAHGAGRYHLNVLMSGGFVVQFREGRHVRYFVAGDLPADAAVRGAALRSHTARRVYDLYSQEPTLPLREAGRRLGLSAPTVHRQRRRLEKIGLLEVARSADRGRELESQ